MQRTGGTEAMSSPVSVTSDERSGAQGETIRAYWTLDRL